MRSRVIRSLVIFVVIAIGATVAGRLVMYNLPPNDTSRVTMVRILAGVVLRIGGPIVGLILGAMELWGNAAIPANPAALPLLIQERRQSRRTRLAIYAAIAGGLGLALAGLAVVMAVPVAWLAGGGDMPPGDASPANVQVGREMLYGLVAIAAAGALLMLCGLGLGIALLLRRK